MTTTRKDGRLRRNDANYCRLKGWQAGTVLTIDRSDHLVFHHGITSRQWLVKFRITAVGDECVLVRQIYDSREGGEERWARRLVESLVVGVELPAEDSP